MKLFQPQPHSGETVLLVADKPLVRGLAARMLRSMGFNVLEAADGVFALAAIAKLGSPIDLLITEVAMPRMGGHELAKRLTAEQPALPVLFLEGGAKQGLEGWSLQSVPTHAEFDLVEFETAVAESFAASAA